MANDTCKVCPTGTDCSSVGVTVATLPLLQDWWRLPNSTVLKVLKAIIATEDNYYPERLNKYLIINAPRIFSAIWKIVRAFVDPVTREKIHIVSGNSRELLLK